jgi:hypothetical protein
MFVLGLFMAIDKPHMSYSQGKNQKEASTTIGFRIGDAGIPAAGPHLDCGIFKNQKVVVMVYVLVLYSWAVFCFKRDNDTGCWGQVKCVYVDLHKIADGWPGWAAAC